jgi:hypothetical protein
MSYQHERALNVARFMTAVALMLSMTALVVITVSILSL